MANVTPLFDAAGGAEYSNLTTGTHDIVVGSGNNRAVFVCIGHEANLISWTVNGVGVTQIGAVSANSRQCHLGYVLAPATGTLAVVTGMDSSGHHTTVSSAYSNVNQDDTLVGTVASLVSGTATVQVVTTDGAADGLGIYGHSGTNRLGLGMEATSDCIERNEVSSFWMNAGIGEEPGTAPSQTMGSSFNTSDHFHTIGIGINGAPAPAAGGGAAFFFSLAGLSIPAATAAALWRDGVAL